MRTTLAAPMLIGAALSLAACMPSTEAIARQIALCKMEALKIFPAAGRSVLEYIWFGLGSEFIRNCMRAAGYELNEASGNRRCLGDSQSRIELPECYRQTGSWWPAAQSTKQP